MDGEAICILSPGISPWRQRKYAGTYHKSFVNHFSLYFRCKFDFQTTSKEEKANKVDALIFYVCTPIFPEKRPICVIHLYLLN